MKIKVVEDLCIGCGICEGIAPEVFSLETEPYAVVLLEAIPEELQADVREAADACPEAAIEIEE
ncbi:MAG TPA: ferredoxin [Anaerolineaceae bacterium]|nr:ferredoxin [Anaerolineaceae bacterium]